MALVSLISFFAFVMRRLRNNPGPVLATAIGLLVAVTMVMSVPLYAEAVDYRLLRDELRAQQAGRWRPPFSFVFRYAGFVHGGMAWQEYRDAEPFFMERSPAIIDLPLEFSVRHVATGLLRVYPATTPATVTETQPIDFSAFAFVTDLEAHIVLTEGSLPTRQVADGNDPLQVLVMESWANEVGIGLHEELIVRRTAAERGPDDEQIIVRVQGVWRARDPADSYWFNHPSDLARFMLVLPESFEQRVVPVFKKPVSEAIWYLVFDGSSIRPDKTASFIERIKATRVQMAAALPNAEIDSSPESVLLAFAGRTQLVTILMYVFAIPIVCLVLYSIVFMSNLVVYQQRHEIAVLRSRGVSQLQVGALYVVERLLLGAGAIGAGAVLAQPAAQVMGTVRSFLVFAPDGWLNVALSGRALVLGGVGIALAVTASVMPALRASGMSIVSHKQDVARSLHRPAWQRYYLDIVLLAVALYGYDMLRRRGTISILSQGGRTLDIDLFRDPMLLLAPRLLGSGAGFGEGDPFRNPLLFLAPTVFVFALALVFVRFLPVLLDALGRISAAPLPILLALRQVGRSREQYAGPLLLIVLTLGMACLIATTAKTLDHALTDQVYYEVGADARVREAGELTEDAGPSVLAPPGQFSSSAPAQYPRFLPVSEHLSIAGVRAATRLATYGGAVRLAGREVRASITGIDRASYPGVGFFRPDFSPDSLGALLNRLALTDQAALISSADMRRYNLRVGDPLDVELYIAGVARVAMPLTVAGVTDLFPTVYPVEGAIFVVTNLDYMFERMGGEYAYDVLMRTQPGTAAADIAASLVRMGIDVRLVKDARAMIAAEQTVPERQGILGLLSLGFLASALLSVLGYLFHTLLAFERRAVEFGVLRAIGLSQRQMAAYLGVEQALLITVSVGAGTAIGVLASMLFIPFFQVRSGAHAQVPPFTVSVAWTDLAAVYIVFGAMLLAAIAGLVWRLQHLRLATAIKMGETV